MAARVQATGASVSNSPAGVRNVPITTAGRRLAAPIGGKARTARHRSRCLDRNRMAPRATVRRPPSFEVVTSGGRKRESARRKSNDLARAGMHRPNNALETARAHVTTSDSVMIGAWPTSPAPTMISTRKASRALRVIRPPSARIMNNALRQNSAMEAKRVPVMTSGRRMTSGRATISVAGMISVSATTSGDLTAIAMILEPNMAPKAAGPSPASRLR